MAKPQVPYQSKLPFFRGTGRRKTAVARVRIMQGKGNIIVNQRPLDVYFTEERDRAAVLGPLMLTELVNRLDVVITVHGGGSTGQAGAVSQGLARAIKLMFAPAEGAEAAPAPAPAVEGAEGAPTPAPAAEASPEAGIVRKLRDSGFLTRDSRMKERKKFGRKGARKSFQFSKR